MTAHDAAIAVRLLRWGESSSGGRTVTFELDMLDGEHPFKGLTAGTKNGQRMAIAVVLIADDETETALPDAVAKRAAEIATPPSPAAMNAPVTEYPKPKQRFADMPRAQQAGIMCNELLFVNWLFETGPPEGDNNEPPIEEEGWAAKQVRRRCGVMSRTQFDRDLEAGARWDALLTQYHRDTGRSAEDRS